MRLLNSRSPSAEQALTLMQTSLAAKCLCFQYAGPTGTGNSAASGTFDIADGGALTLPDANGECVETTYVTYQDGGETIYPGTPGYDPTGETLDERFHLRVPVTNEACLYQLWMCSCWASQTDGCLCAQENNGLGTVTIIKPSQGCPIGSGEVTDTSAAGDTKGHALLGFGGLAL